MKTLSILASMLLLSAGAAFAQSQSAGNTMSNDNLANTTTRSPQTAVSHDVTGFSNPYTGPGVTKESVSRPPNMHPNLKPALGGAGTATAKYGPVMLSPLAPASYGMGERYLSAPDPRADTAHECGPAAHRDSGGIKLFSIDF
jgi:hypothetical protein